MASCSNPSAVAGGIEITSGPYAHTTKVVYQCSTGYAMSGNPYVTCSNGVFTGTYPVCNLQDTNSVSVNITDNTDDDIPSWLFYLIAALVGLIMFLILTCVMVWCCQLFGFYGGGSLFGPATSERGCWCCRRRRYDPNSEQSHLKQQCTTFPRRYLFDKYGRRFHYDDVGRACYYNHRHQNGKAVAPVNTEESSIITVNEINDKKVAKELAAWKPHQHNVRNINTSTK